MTALLVAVVRAYQRFLSPLLPPRCRFAPTCSSYAVLALQEHGALRGSWLAVRRVARCHPFHPGGHDPVPARGGGIGDNGGTAVRTAPGTAAHTAVGTAVGTAARTAARTGAGTRRHLAVRPGAPRA